MAMCIQTVPNKNDEKITSKFTKAIEGLEPVQPPSDLAIQLRNITPCPILRVT
jgi:hypothetical protein